MTSRRAEGACSGTLVGPHERKRSRMLAAGLVFVSVLGMSAAETCAAQGEIGTAASDRAEGMVRVWYEPPPRSSGESDWLPQPLRVSSGTLLEFSRERVRLRPSDGEAVQSIPARRVVWMQPQWRDERASEGMAAFADGRYEEAIGALLAAIKLRPPVHEQYWLTGHLALAAYQANKYAATLELVRSLDASGAPVPVYGLLPVRWRSRPSSPQAVAAAREAVQNESPLVRLVAASWLLSSPADRLVAERILDALAADKQRPDVARLAAVVRYRRASIPQVSTLAKKWMREVETLPIALQAGPWLTVGDRLESAGELAEAREAYLTVALLHQCPRPWTDEARTALESMPAK